MTAHRLSQFDPTDVGLQLGVQMKELSPDARVKFLTALAVASGEAWQKVEELPKSRSNKRARCQCQITQYRLEHRAPEFFACKNYATWKINDILMCGTHANAFVWERVLKENGYENSDGILIQDGIRSSEGRSEPHS